MAAEKVWYVYKDVHGQYSVSEFLPDGFRVAGPFTWTEAETWMQQHGVPGW